VTRGMIVDVHADDPADPAGVPMGVIWIGGLVVMVAFLAESAAEGWSALHIERTLEGSPAQGAFGPAMLGLMMGVGRLSGHLVSGAMSDTRMMQVASGMCAAGLALAAVAPSVPVALAGFALAGLGISVVGPLALALIGRLVPRSARLYAISRASVLGHVAFLIGPVLMGVVSQGFGLRVAFGVIVVVLVAVVAGLIPRLARAGGR